MNLPRERSFYLIAAGFAAACVLPFAALFVMRTGLTYPCPFKFWTGLPCPTCGATRALAALASLDLPAALAFNPLLVLGGAAAAAGFALRRRIPSLPQAGLPLLLGAVLLNWIYLILYLPR